MAITTKHEVKYVLLRRILPQDPLVPNSTRRMGPAFSQVRRLLSKHESVELNNVYPQHQSLSFGHSLILLKPKVSNLTYHEHYMKGVDI